MDSRPTVFDRFDDLFYPPGFSPIPESETAEERPPPSPVCVEPYTFKYTPAEAQLRILSCCRDLGISTTKEVKYPDVQKAYKLKFGIPLNKDEIQELFARRKTTQALKNGVEAFLDITDASQNDVIKLRLKENSQEYIKGLEAEYDGDEMPRLTLQQIHKILHPVPILHERIIRRPIFPPNQTDGRPFQHAPRQNNQREMSIGFNRARQGFNQQRNYDSANIRSDQQQEPRGFNLAPPDYQQQLQRRYPQEQRRSNQPGAHNIYNNNPNVIQTNHAPRQRFNQQEVSRGFNNVRRRFVPPPSGYGKKPPRGFDLAPPGYCGSEPPRGFNAPPLK